MPSFKHTLISIGKLCDAGCAVTFTQSNITVVDTTGHTVLQGRRKEQGARLWHFNLRNATHPRPLQDRHTPPSHLAHPHKTIKCGGHKTKSCHGQSSSLDAFSILLSSADTLPNFALDSTSKPTTRPTTKVHSQIMSTGHAPQLPKLTMVTNSALPCLYGIFMPVRGFPSKPLGLQPLMPETMPHGLASHTPQQPSTAPVLMKQSRAT